MLELGNPNLHTWYTNRLKRYIFYFRQEMKDGIKLILQRIKDWRFRTKENLNLHNRINIHFMNTLLKAIQSLASLFIGDNNSNVDCKYLNLKDAILITKPCRLNRVTINEFIFGFRIVFVSGIYIEFYISTSENSLPPIIPELRNLCINNMGSSFVMIDDSFKEVCLKIVSLK